MNPDDQDSEEEARNARKGNIVVVSPTGALPGIVMDD